MSKAYNPKDYYFKLAKTAGYRARSAFKLEEIQAKFKILKPGIDVLDLGAAPGSWLQYAQKIVGQKAKLIGVDLSPIAPIAKNVTTIVGDIFAEETMAKIKKIHAAPFAIILTDLAPKTSGVKELDQACSLSLNRQVIELAGNLLAPGGVIVLKIFQSGELNIFIKELKKEFGRVIIHKPKASRQRSYELYLIIRK